MNTPSKKKEAKKTAQELPVIETLIDNENTTVYSVDKNFFPILWEKKIGYAVLLGTNRISEFFATFEEAVEDSKRNDINRIITIIQIIQKIKP